jgi:hypothetical protein
MADRDLLWRVLDRLTAFLPSGPRERPSSPSRPDPYEPGISGQTRTARLRMLHFRHGKPKK